MIRAFFATGLAALLASTLIASGASAAKPLVNVHEGPVTNGPVPMAWCDELEGTAVFRSVVGVRLTETGAVQNAHTTMVFTATATGRSIMLSQSGLVRFSVVDNRDGTTTYSSKGAGLDLAFRILNGPVLRSASGQPLRSAGESDTTLIVDNATGEWISFKESVHGPHLFDDGVEVCGPTLTYLLGL
jgi:hypothetical protein